MFLEVCISEGERVLSHSLVYGNAAVEVETRVGSVGEQEVSSK